MDYFDNLYLLFILSLKSLYVNGHSFIHSYLFPTTTYDFTGNFYDISIVSKLTIVIGLKLIHLII